MRFNKFLNLIGTDQSSESRGRRQIAAVLCALLLGGCAAAGDALDEVFDLGKPEPAGVAGRFLGGVAADEPRAALVGYEILRAGGNAADAATAVYFALAVTKPSSASLGGGGVCVVEDIGTETTKALDFLAGAPRTVPPTATRPSAVPGNVRGFSALHSKYGRLRWAQVVAPAATMARFGVQVSRAFARDLAKVEKALLMEPGTRRVFGRKDGRGLVGEGDILVQGDLAATLSLVSSQGPGSLYQGQMARRLVAAVERAGGSLGLEDLRAFAPVWRDTIKITFGDGTMHLAPPPAAAGAVAAEMWAMLVQDGRYKDAADGERPHLVVETAMRAFADRARWLRGDGTSTVAPEKLVSEARITSLMASYRRDRHVPAAELDPAPVARPENPAATSFVVVDGDGSAVACALTMNNLFGTGRVAKGTGILIAALPGQGGRGPISLVSMVVMTHKDNQFYAAAAASGGVAAPTAMVNVIAPILFGGRLDDAMSAKRLHHGGVPDLTYYEQGISETVLKSLTERGHRVAPTMALGLVNVAFCSDGLPQAPQTCAVRADPRGFGLAKTVEE